MNKWKSGKVEKWKSGKVERWKGGKVERWKSEKVGKWKGYQLLAEVSPAGGGRGWILTSILPTVNPYRIL
jgi:hypothetical protein